MLFVELELVELKLDELFFLSVVSGTSGDGSLVQAARGRLGWFVCVLILFDDVA